MNDGTGQLLYNSSQKAIISQAYNAYSYCLLRLLF